MLEEPVSRHDSALDIQCGKKWFQIDRYSVGKVTVEYKGPGTARAGLGKWTVSRGYDLACGELIDDGELEAAQQRFTTVWLCG